MLFVNTFVGTLTFTGCVSNICWVAGITALYVTVLEEGMSPSDLVHTDVSVYKNCVTVFHSDEGFVFLIQVGQNPLDNFKVSSQ
jgi:hypothetical protein